MVDYVGVNGGFGADLAQTGKVNSQEELDAKLANYIYGYNVAAGRSAYSNAANECDGGVAGGTWALCAAAWSATARQTMPKPCAPCVRPAAMRALWKAAARPTWVA